MPRRSPYAIELSKAEGEELATRARRYTSPYREVIRAKIVLLAAQGWRTMSSPGAWTPHGRSSANGASASTMLDYRASRRSLEAGDQPAFPPSVVVEVKALACELPHRRGRPLARWSMAELRRDVVNQGIVAQISGTPLWRWLSQDALRPWRYRS